MRVLRKIKSDTSLTVDENTMSNGHVKDNTPYSFYENIRFALILSQFFGIMPLHNIRKTGQEVKFKILSFRFLYGILHIVCVSSTSVACIWKMALKGFIIDESAVMCFYIFNTGASMYFMFLASKWQRILREFAYVEVALRNYTSGQNIKKMKIWVTTVFMLFGLTEHILFILNNLYHSMSCKQYKMFPVDIYFGTTFPQWFLLIEYSHWMGALIEFTNFISTFTWNYTDLFIILISVSLKEKFDQISIRIKNSKNQPSKLWKEVREDYYKISNLTKIVDAQIAGLVLISFLNNIFFLCIQLYNSIKDREAAIESIYFFYSFGYIVFRLVAVSLYSAALNEAARKPLKYLYLLPTEHYTIDVSRLITQINYLPNGITGHGFFLITKNFLLQATATVVTLELMIFQFAPAKTNTSLSANNSSSTTICIK